MKLNDISTADNNVRYVQSVGPLSFCGMAHESRYKWLLNNLDLKDKAILDSGCGSGYGSYMLSRVAKLVHGIDCSRKAIDFAKAIYYSNNLNFFIVDACSQEIFRILKKNSYDIVVSFDVIEHIERYFDYLENICGILKRDGFLVIGTPNRLQLFRWNRRWNPFHFQEFSPYQLRKILSLYFEDVVLAAQDFYDEPKREAARISNYGTFVSAHLQIFKKLLPNFLKIILKKLLIILKPTKVHGFKCSDIEFKIEPDEDLLQRAFGLIAICKKPKIKFGDFI